MNVFDSCGSILDVVDEVTYGVERFVSGMERVSADQLGLDIRAGRVYIDRAERVIVAECSRSIDYYGGFEYIDKECRMQLGEYTIYTECGRVNDCFDYLEDTQTEDAE